MTGGRPEKPHVEQRHLVFSDTDLDLIVTRACALYTDRKEIYICVSDTVIDR